jgi:uncharacterized cofD-like protein
MRSWQKKWPGLKWLYPGIGVKRWVLALLGGITALSMGLAYVLVAIYRAQPLPELFYYITLQFIPRLVRAILFVGIGATFVAIALYYLNRSLLSVMLADKPCGPGEASAQPAERMQGPRIVTVGGGHGLSTLLRGLKNHTSSLTAIVTVADDGGSSGVLREQLGLLPPGDLRDCIAALADAEPLMTELLQYRFGQGSGLNGHSFGNLFIAAMAGITGNFDSAISGASRVLAVRGRILPSALEDVTLCAEVRERGDPHAESSLVQGESRITATGGVIERMYLQPSHVRGNPQAIRALLHADMIVLGPGSLYTSVLPNLLVEDISNAIRASQALKVYVGNVATQPGETDDFTLGDHVQALAEHLGADFCSYVLGNANTAFELPAASGSVMVKPQYDNVHDCQVVLEDLVDRELPWRHDPLKLATALMRLYYAYGTAVPQEQSAGR